MAEVGDIGMAFGTAGLDPRANYPGYKVLMILTQREYEARRRIRDALHKEKASQEAHQLVTWKQLTNWDYVVPADGNGFRQIIRLMRRPSESVHTAHLV